MIMCTIPVDNAAEAATNSSVTALRQLSLIPGFCFGPLAHKNKISEKQAPKCNQFEAPKMTSDHSFLGKIIQGWQQKSSQKQLVMTSCILAEFS